MELDRLGMPDHERERFERAFSNPTAPSSSTGPTGSGKSHHAVRGAQPSSTRPRRTSSRSRIRSSTSSRGSPRCRSTRAPASPSPPACARCCAPTPTSSWSARSATARRRRSPSSPRSPGHLVLSTLHTNDAPSAITRLIEMGIEPFLVASALDCVVAQRLARTLCPHCKRRTIVPAEVLQEPASTPHLDLEAYEPAGCSRCSGSGYKGRAASTR